MPLAAIVAMIEVRPHLTYPAVCLIRDVIIFLFLFPDNSLCFVFATTFRGAPEPTTGEVHLSYTPSWK